MTTDPHPTTTPHVIDRVQATTGELVLRRAGDHFEIISNGTFLMDTRNGESERLLVDAALNTRPGKVSLDTHPAGPRRVLIGGLGVGFSLRAALRHPGTTVTVVEIEPAIIQWHHDHLRAFSGGALDDPRVTVICQDLLTWLHPADTGDTGENTADERYDAICLDIDNGPTWTVTDANRGLYDTTGLQALHRRLRPQGVVAFWSAAASTEFERRLNRYFATVDIHQIPVPRGEPDVIYIARTPVRPDPTNPFTPA